MRIKLSTVYTVIVVIAMFLIAQIVGALAEPVPGVEVAYAKRLCATKPSRKCPNGLVYRCTRHAYNSSPDPHRTQLSWSRSCGCSSKPWTLPAWSLEDQARYCSTTLGEGWNAAAWADDRDVEMRVVRRWMSRGPERAPTADDRSE